jgi:hypothetical protein
VREQQAPDIDADLAAPAVFFMVNHLVFAGAEKAQIDAWLEKSGMNKYGEEADTPEPRKQWVPPSESLNLTRRSYDLATH